MPQNVVSGGAMEIKVGHHEVNQVGLAFEGHCVFTERQSDVTILRAINVTGFEGLHEGQCLSEPRLEIGKGLLDVFVFRDVDPREPRSGSLGEIGCNLELPNECKHVRGKPVIEQDFRINLAVAACASALSMIAERLFSIWTNAGMEA